MSQTFGRVRVPLVAGALVAAIGLTAFAQTRERASVPARYTWNLADIYPNDAAWRAEKDAIAKQVPAIANFKGKLGSSAATLADTLDKLYALDKTLSRLYVYASLLADQDTRDAAHQGMQQELIQLYTQFGAQA